MAVNALTLVCLVSGEALSNTFSVKISPSESISVLKDLIKSEKTPEYDDIAADRLTLWRVTIPSDENAGDESIITLDDQDAKTKLGNPRTSLSEQLPESLDDNTYILVQRPLACVDPEVAVLGKQLSDMLDSSIKHGIIIKPEKEVAFIWPAIVDTATLDDLRKNVFYEYPHYAHDKHLEIFVHNGQTKPARIGDDEDLRKILKIAKAASKTKLTISLATPTKAFSLWKFKDVCAEYNLSESADVGIDVVPPFTDIQAAPLDSDCEKKVLAQLKIEIESRVEVLKLVGANEATKSMVVASFLVAVTKLFKEDLYLASKRDFRGRRGNGPLDFSVHSRSTHNYSLVVTEVKKEDFDQGVAQNIVQLESILTATKKRKREKHDIDGEEEEIRSYGIVTDAEKWYWLNRQVAGGCEICFRKACLALVADAG
ncbi:hypothetical protein EDD11_007609 [Mortierella claussenii]|nr:hypothetical protein EDD11_007609 [Mortierella claussenii]